VETLCKKSLFWDVEPGSLSPESHWFFIIERVMEFGDIDDLRWLKRTFTPEQIASTVKKSRKLSRRIISYCKAAGYASAH
jgi:hypothetical protein